MTGEHLSVRLLTSADRYQEHISIGINMSSNLHRNPPFRAEHLGSLLRPKELLEKRDAAYKEQSDFSQLKPVEDAAIKDIVEKQQKWGFRAVTDGEYRYDNPQLCPTVRSLPCAVFVDR